MMVPAEELFDTAALHHPYPLYRRLRAEAPVHQIGDSGFYLALGRQAVIDAVDRVDEFSSNLTATMVYDGDGAPTAFDMAPLGDRIHVLATADDPIHAAHRKLLIPQLAAKRIRAAESFIAEAADRCWREGVTGGRIEWMRAVANRLPMTVVARLIGVPEKDADRLVAWAYAATQLLDGVASPDQLEAAGRAAGQLAGYIAGHFKRAAADPQDDLLGDLAAASASGALDRLVAQLIMVTLFGAGGESTAGLIGNAVSILAARPDIQQRLRRDPSLLEAFIEEVLRYESPFRGHYRHVRLDTTLGGVELPRDAHLLLLWAAANRDPAHFDAPDEFRLDRPNAKGHLAFGRGAHFCVGAALARSEARVVVRMLLANTSHFEAVTPAVWLPSISVRRLERLELALH